jgi:hypothetical protein
MKLTLRKANAVQHSINEMIKSLDLSTNVSLNEFVDVKDQIQTVRDRFWTHAATRNKLVLSLYEIRQKVANANAAAGINDMLAEVAHLEKQIGHNTMLAGKGVQTALVVLNGQLKKQADAKEDAYGYNSRRDVTTSIFSEAEVETFRREAADGKRQKQKLQDALLELNVQTEIELEEGTALFLEKADIL